MTKPTRRANQQGMSLIEVIISMFMLGVLLVLYVSALNTVAITRKLRNENLAYHIASKQMEELRALTYSALPPAGTITNPLLAQLPSGSGEFTVTDFAGYYNMKEIEVTVDWNDGLSKQVVIKTLAGTGGINP